MPYELAMSGPYTESTGQVTILLKIQVDSAAAGDLIAALRALGTPAPSIPRQRAGEPLTLIPASRKTLRHGHPLDLTRLEFDLLVFLCSNPHRVHRRHKLMHEVWDSTHIGNSRTIDVHIRRLRAKLGPTLPIISTVRGIGYIVERTDLYAIHNEP